MFAFFLMPCDEERTIYELALILMTIQHKRENSFEKSMKHIKRLAA
jgi:hypothetical protein